MKKPIRTPESAAFERPAEPGASAVEAGFRQSGPLWIAAEVFAFLLTALLPIKFASIVSAPEAGALYWSDPLSLLIIAWPLPVFMLAASILLALTVAAAAIRGNMTLRVPLLKYGALWGVLGCVSLLGFADASCMGYPSQMIAHALSLAAYAISLSILLSGRRDFARLLTGALVLGGVLSLCSGLYQYRSGFEALREHLESLSYAAGRDVVSESMAVRIGEARIQADFSSCNVYGAYLAGLLPFLAAVFWRFGDERVSPPKLSRILFCSVALAVTSFLLVKTDSRGAVLSLLDAGAIVFFLSSLPRKWKIAGAALLLLGVVGLVAMIRFGRGALSIFVRFDYVQSAGRMMLEHPLTGTGWGDFLHDHSIFRLWCDKEAAHSPHNMAMLFGSQCGVAGFAAALAVLAYPVFAACRQVRRTNWRDRKDVLALVPGISCLILSIGILLDIGFETTAYSGVLIVFSLLVLARHAPAEPTNRRSPGLWAVVALLMVFASFSLAMSRRVFQAEKAYSALIGELNPTYSQEHSAEPGYVPSYARVQAVLREAAEAAPRSPFPWNAAADYFMFAAVRPDEALACVDKTIELDPLQAAHYVKRARMLYALAGKNVTDEVRRDLETARRLSPKNPELNRPDADICREAFTPKEP